MAGRNFSCIAILITTSKTLTMKPSNKRKAAKAPGGEPKRQKAQAGGSKPKRPVSVDALSWKTVDVPEMYNDAEGFYGLEVVEGVDIVNHNGTVQFVSFAHLEIFRYIDTDTSSRLPPRVRPRLRMLSRMKSLQALKTPLKSLRMVPRSYRLPQR